MIHIALYYDSATVRVQYDTSRRRADSTRSIVRRHRPTASGAPVRRFAVPQATQQAGDVGDSAFSCSSYLLPHSEGARGMTPLVGGSSSAIGAISLLVLHAGPGAVTAKMNVLHMVAVRSGTD